MSEKRTLWHMSLIPACLDAKAAQAICWTGSLAGMVAGIWKVAQLELSEPQLCCGILLVMAVTMLGVIAGLLMPIVEFVARQQRDT